MYLKRKRSDSEISAGSAMLTPHKRIGFNDVANGLPSINSPSLFASRTRKRSRDNRPSEAEIHQHTLSLLFSAKQSTSLPESASEDLSMFGSPTSSAFPSHQDVASAISSANEPGPRQHSLHAFWSIPNTQHKLNRCDSSSTSGSASPSMSPAAIPVFEELNYPGDAMHNVNAEMELDIDMNMTMDVDMSVGKTWVGGLGWVQN